MPITSIGGRSDDEDGDLNGSNGNRDNGTRLAREEDDEYPRAFESQQSNQPPTRSNNDSYSPPPSPEDISSRIQLASNGANTVVVSSQNAFQPISTSR